MVVQWLMFRKAAAPQLARRLWTTLLEHIGPYPIRISRNDRVTVEEAPVTFPNPQILCCKRPTRSVRPTLKAAQERGLYLWTMGSQISNGAGEPRSGEMPLPGGELYTRPREVYISRPLKCGATRGECRGAYRIFTNLLSAGKRTVAVTWASPFFLMAEEFDNYPFERINDTSWTEGN